MVQKTEKAAAPPVVAKPAAVKSVPTPAVASAKPAAVAPNVADLIKATVMKYKNSAPALAQLKKKDTPAQNSTVVAQQVSIPANSFSIVQAPEIPEDPCHQAQQGPPNITPAGSNPNNPSCPNTHVV